MTATASPQWVALSLIDHLGGKRMRALLAHFDGDLDAVLRADEADLRRVNGIGPQLSRAIRTVQIERTAAQMREWAKHGVRFLTWDDPRYPARLNRLEDAPPTLFAAGEASPGSLNERSHVAIVGTRQPTPTAIEAAHALGFDLARRGRVVVSGLALGTDANAHMGALAAPDGITLAVLGSGVLNIYPPANRALAGAVMGRGAVFSEQPPLREPTPSSLVARNRIISGLCDALVVIETSITGGAMHAARRAREQGRTVYALDLPDSGNRALMDDEGAIRLSLDFHELA